MALLRSEFSQAVAHSLPVAALEPEAAPQSRQRINHQAYVQYRAHRGALSTRQPRPARRRCSTVPGGCRLTRLPSISWRSGYSRRSLSKPAAAAASAAPAGWYADPSSRYELRYWDGSTWTEHVSRGGQQFTDPPVA